MLKRSLAVLLSVLMLLSVIGTASMTAFAQEGNSDETNRTTVAYFVNSYGWESVAAHIWVEDENGAGTGLNGWPGDLATLVEGTDNVYSFDCSFVEK